MAALPTGLTITYEPRGAALELFQTRTPEYVMAGPAGTGKTRAGLEYCHLVLSRYPKARGLLVRKTLTSLKGTALVTFDEKIRPDLDGVIFRGETARRPPQYQYPNGSTLTIGGLDKASKVMSSDYDIIFVPEATELTVDEWEALTTRLRNGALPFQRLIGDCNPGAPTHWLKQRANSGLAEMRASLHSDNPAATPEYIARLERLTGVRRLRLLLGIWAAAEGMVYQDSYSDALNRLARWPTSYDNPRGNPPREWTRYLSIDFGYSHPFVCQWYAEDTDGRLYRYRELYRTKGLVEDHAAAIMRASGWELRNGVLYASHGRSDPLPRAIICDHDAEGRATLERHMGHGTTAAHKAVLEGIQLVASRWRPAGDGRPRLYLVRDSLIDADPELVDARQPVCTEDEVEAYVWDIRPGGSKAEAPVKEYDHGLDAARYMVAHRDMRPASIHQGQALY